MRRLDGNHDQFLAGNGHLNSIGIGLSQFQSTRHHFVVHCIRYKQRNYYDNVTLGQQERICYE